MADRAAWVRQAYLRYHAGEIGLDELQRLVAEHHADPAVSRETETPVLDREPR